MTSASHGTGKMCKTNRSSFSSVHKTSSREVNRHGQSICTIVQHTDLTLFTNQFAIPVPELYLLSRK